MSGLYIRDSGDHVECALGDYSGMQKIKKEQNVSCDGTYKGSNKVRFFL